MDFCFNCGGKTDPDWVFCRACGSALEDDTTDLVIPGPVAGAPKVELISRGWDDQVVETVEVGPDPLVDDDVGKGPLPPGAVEIQVDDITVVDAPDEPSESEPRRMVDPWDHLRPRGEMPPLQRDVTLPGRIGQSLVLLAALGALSAAAIHFYLNTRLNAFSEGRVTASAIDDLATVADMSLLVLAGLVVIAAGGLGWWVYRALPMADFRLGQAGTVALVALVAGTGLVVWPVTLDAATVTEAIGANSLIVLGLGLLMAACLATVRSVDRIDRKEPV